MKDTDGQLHDAPYQVADCLRKHWQDVFETKQTDKSLRQRWMRHVKDRFKASVDELRPTDDDIIKVLDALPDSSCGPDDCSQDHPARA